MKVAGVDWIPVLAIAVGSTAGAMSFVAIAGLAGGHEHKAVVHEEVVKTAAPRAAVHPAEQIRIRGQSTGSGLAESQEPIVYVDGLRVEDLSVVQRIDPDAIESIEVFKGEAAVEQVGEADAARGVVRVYLKR